MNWLIEKDAEKVSALSQSMRDKVCVEIKKLLGVSQSFSPWMCLYLINQHPSFIDLFEEKYDKHLLLVNDQKIEKISERIFNLTDHELDHIGLWSKKLFGLDSEIKNTNPIASDLFEKSLDFIFKTNANLEKIYNSVVNVCIPMSVQNNSASTHGAKGVIFLSVPKVITFETILEMSIRISHELGHQVLIIYQSADRILESDLAEKVYSGVRMTERPAIQSFHALVALYFMLNFLVNIKLDFSNDQNSLIKEKINDLTKKINDTTESLNKCKFTELGKALKHETDNFIKSSLN
jgi:hypothetical protein